MSRLPSTGHTHACMSKLKLLPRIFVKGSELEARELAFNCRFEEHVGDFGGFCVPPGFWGFCVGRVGSLWYQGGGLTPRGQWGFPRSAPRGFPDPNGRTLPGGKVRGYIIIPLCPLYNINTGAAPPLPSNPAPTLKPRPYPQTPPLPSNPDPRLHEPLLTYRNPDHNRVLLGDLYCPRNQI